jgi:hypothetical protein
MRPEKAKIVIENAIKAALSGDINPLYECNFLKAVNKLMEKLKVELAESWFEYDIYQPTLKDYGSIQNELFYISDRFNTPHRLKWLSFGVDNNQFNRTNVTEYIRCLDV